MKLFWVLMLLPLVSVSQVRAQNEIQHTHEKTHFHNPIGDDLFDANGNPLIVRVYEMHTHSESHSHAITPEGSETQAEAETNHIASLEGLDTTDHSGVGFAANVSPEEVADVLPTVQGEGDLAESVGGDPVRAGLVHDHTFTHDDGQGDDHTHIYLHGHPFADGHSLGEGPPHHPMSYHLSQSNHEPHRAGERHTLYKQTPNPDSDDSEPISISILIPPNEHSHLVQHFHDVDNDGSIDGDDDRHYHKILHSHSPGLDFHDHPDQELLQLLREPISAYEFGQHNVKFGEHGHPSSSEVHSSPPPPPMTGKFNVPPNHDGAGTEFTVELTFKSYPPENTEAVCRALRVTGGTVTECKTKVGSADASWIIKIAPTSNARVDLRLPKSTTNCRSSSAICGQFVGVDGDGQIRTVDQPLSMDVLAMVDGPGSGKAVAASAPLGLAPNVPNPFNASTYIPYRLATPGAVRLEIYNIAGQPVRRLVDQSQAAGVYQVYWDARDQRGAAVAAGVYLARLHYPGGVQTRRMLYLK